MTKNVPLSDAEFTEVFEAIKTGEFSLQSLVEYPIPDEQKKLLADKFIKWQEARMETDDFTPTQPDPIDRKQKQRTWGTKQADERFSPIEDHSYIVFAGKASSGKTAFCFDLGVKNSKWGKVLFISLEMAENEIFSRISKSFAGITKEEWRDRKNIQQNKRDIYKRKYQQLQDNSNMVCCGISEPTIDNILEKIRREEPLLTLIDNFDLVSNTTGDQMQHERETSRKIMEFCHKEKFPIIIMNHIKKTNETGVDSIRGNAKIVDDADGVFRCFRSTENLEELTDRDRRRFSVHELKDRSFGHGGFNNFSFNRGTFDDEESQPGFN